MSGAPPPVDAPPFLDDTSTSRVDALRPWARRVAAVVAAVVFLVCIGGWLTVRHYDGKITRIPLTIAGARPADATGGAQNLLIVGSDSRSGPGDGGAAAAATVAGARSDTILLVHLDKGSGASVVSFPRDTIVNIPSYTGTSGTVHASQHTRINAAFDEGGPSLLIRTIEGLTGIRVDRYLQVDFGGFKTLSTAVGGVDVCIKASTFKEFVQEDGKVSTNTNDPMSGFVGHDGINHISGDQALAFVRQRHGLANSDLGRIQRQQAFITALVHKTVSASLLVDPFKLKKVLDAGTSSLEVNNVSISDLQKLASRLTAPGKTQFLTIPTHPNADGATLGYDPAQLAAFFKKITGGTSAAATTPPQVTVLNASGVAGAAGKIATGLRAHGITVVATGNTTGSGSGIEVRYAPGNKAGAKTVANALNDAKTVEDSTLAGAKVVVVVHDGAATVKAAAAPPDAGGIEPAAYTTSTLPRTGPLLTTAGIPGSIDGIPCVY